jgi:hypothetical protein
MDALELVRSKLMGKPLSELGVVSAATGVSTSTIYKIVKGITKNPRHNSLEPLRAHFADDPK